jgi:hypothetical protein
MASVMVLLKPCEADGASRSESEPKTSLETQQWEWPAHRRVVKPARSVKAQANATDRLPGVRAGSAHRERDRGT